MINICAENGSCGSSTVIKILWYSKKGFEVLGSNFNVQPEGN